MNLFIWNIHTQQIHTDKKQISSCQEQGEEGQWGVNATGYGVSYLANEKVPELYNGNDCTTCEHTKNQSHTPENCEY